MSMIAKGTVSGIWMNWTELTEDGKAKPARLKLENDDGYFSTYKKDLLKTIKKGDVVEFTYIVSEHGGHRNIESIKVLATTSDNIEPKKENVNRQDTIINQLVLKSVAGKLFEHYNPQTDEEIEIFLMRCVRWCEKRVWMD